MEVIIPQKDKPEPSKHAEASIEKQIIGVFCLKSQPVGRATIALSIMPEAVPPLSMDNAPIVMSAQLFITEKSRELK